MSNPSLTVVDLFAGAGGLSEGFRQVPGFRTVAAVENDVAAAATFKCNHPDVELYTGDIAAWLETSARRADVVVGGPPCQGFSALGNRRVRDPRNALWRRYVDALVVAKPLYFVMENVADFLKSGQYRDLRRETHRGRRLYGYRIEAGILNAADFRTPQVRRRAVLIGSRLDLPAPGLPLGSVAGRTHEWVSVAQALAGLAQQVDVVALPSGDIQHADKTLPGSFKTSQLHIGRRPTDLSLLRYAAIPEGGNRRDIPEHLLAECWRNHSSGSGDVMGRLRWDKPSVTIRTEFWKPEKGRYLHPTANRAITHAEAARLQGFPDDYLWCGSKAQIGRQIGNAVPVQLATGIAKHLESQLVQAA